MKKIFLTSLMAIFFILPCVFLMTACTEPPPPTTPPPVTPPPVTPPPTGSNYTINIQHSLEGVWFTDFDAQEFLSETPLEMQSGESYAVWISDYYNKDTLQVFFDENELILTPCDISDYENRTISELPRKIATFTIPDNLDGIHTVNSSVVEEELSVKFVSNEQYFTSSELEVLSEWCLTAADGASFDTLLDSEYILKTTYTQLTSTQISYTCKKTIGYYNFPTIIKTIDNEMILGCEYLGGENRNNYSFHIAPPDGGFVSKEIELTFDKDALAISSLGIDDANSYSKIISYVDGETETSTYHSWAPNNTNDIKIYLEPYNNVDLSDVEVYIYETKMTLYNDSKKDNKQYFVIPAGKLPVDYYKNTDNLIDPFSAKIFKLTIKNVDVSNSNLFTLFTVTSNNSSLGIYKETMKYFTSEDGTNYYMPNNFAIAGYNFNGQTILPSSVKINDDIFALDDYTSINLNLPVGILADGYDACRNTAGTYYEYRVNIDSKEVYLLISFEDESISHIGVQFKTDEDTIVELIFE